MNKTIYGARAEAARLSRQYGAWYVVRLPDGRIQTRAFAPDMMEGAPELLATYVSGKRFVEEEEEGK